MATDGQDPSVSRFHCSQLDLSSLVALRHEESIKVCCRRLRIRCTASRHRMHADRFRPQNQLEKEQSGRICVTINGDGTSV